MKIFKSLHASLLLLTFSLGIIAGSIIVCIFRISFFVSPLWLFLAIALLILSLAISRYIMLPLALFAGILLTFSRASPDFISQDYINQFIGQNITISGTISKDPDENNGKYNLNLSDLEINLPDGAQPVSGHLFTQANNKTLQRSDRITISGELSSGFGSYIATIYRPELKEISRPEPGDVFLKIRNFFAEKIKAYIPAPESGLALGYLLGQKSGVDKTIKETLQLIGLTHIIVASGAHLSTLTGFARKIFGRLSRFASLLSAISATLFFIGITGLSPSMLRAGLVTGLSLLLWYVGREIRPLRLIILVASATLIYNPFYVTDLAWLLSFLSFSAILVLAPFLTKFLYGKDRNPNFVFATLISSASAGLLTIPVLLFYFGQISLISIFANLLILPTVSIAMGLTFLTGISAIIFPVLAAPLGCATQFILDYQINVANFFGEQKSFLVSMDANNPLIFLLYLPLIVVIFTTFIFSQLKKQKAKKIIENKTPMLADKSPPMLI
ncbi:ComEC/Rec2 family competence protein [Candidatus Saccharibacteria bacterium]|nr:ComEC/Rec2 family competence protein [Candidatus Saccharibacteria bacterium]